MFEPKGDTVKFMDNAMARRRAKLPKQFDVLPEHYIEKTYPRNLLPVPFSHFITNLVLLLVFYTLLVFMERSLPTHLSIKDEAIFRDRFIAERARNYLMNLTRLGPRTVGSFENEVLAVNFLSKEINSIILTANKIHKMTYDLQKVSGAFPLKFLDGMTNIYKDVQNVVVRIGPNQESEHSLLVNCHFDTVIDSPGGSDDGASCAVMLELLRILSRRREPLRHNIIFLFNGAEENFMQASHGFITQHKWAKSVKAFVNLEACGAGGREILFQAGPEHSWLVQVYSEVVPYPFASSLAQEIFQSGLVPGDTDYRMFRDFGKISGLDFAWVSNGYVYHTRLDDVHQIPLGSLQRTGDNMLPLILKLVNSDYLPNVRQYNKGNLVYFDFLGSFIISGKEIFATCINVIIIFGSVYSVWYNMNRTKGVSRSTYIKGLKWGVGFILLSWILTIVFTTSLAFLITLLNRPLSWFARPIWIFFLYIIPTFLTSVFVAQAFKRKFNTLISLPLTVSLIYYDSSICIFTAISTFLTLFMIRSNFIVSIWLAFSFLYWALKTKFTWFKDHKQFWLHSLCFLIPFILSAYIINGVAVFIVPIMGRSGSGNHPELVLSFIMSIMVMLMLNFYIPMTLLVQNLRNAIKGFIGLFITAFLVLLFTPLGFPYSGDLSSPAPQRYLILHVDRTFYDVNGNIRANDSGLWIVNMDVNSPRMVSSLIPEMAKAKPVKRQMCEQELYCGLPYLLPVMTIMWDTHWISAPRPVLPSEISLNLTYKDSRRNDIQRLSFKATGPDHMTLFISPHKGVLLKNWSFLPGDPLEGPRWNNRDTYFVYYSYGSDPQPWNFWLDLQVSNSTRKPIVDIGFGGYFVHGAHQTTPQLKKLFSQFPPWTVTSGWTATYKVFTF